MHAKWIVLLLVILVSCTPVQQPQTQPTPQCKWPEIVSDGGCCRDLNENGVCDTIDFAPQIEQEKQQEYEQAAEKARERAEQSGKLKRTIMNDLYDAASKIQNYRFIYQGDGVVIANGSIVRKLISDYPLGDQNIDGKRIKVVINKVTLDLAYRTAIAECIPPENLVRQNRGTQCDQYLGKTFPVGFDTFAFRPPIKWIEDFLHRTPYETLTGQHVGKLTATLYRFTDLHDAQHKTNLWIDDVTKMPLRVEVWQGDNLVQHEEYLELYVI